MVARIVKMTFKENLIEQFLEVFEQSKIAIRQFQGCQHLELHRGKDHPTIFFTYSHWESEEALQQYRNSTLFKQTWAKTKVLFDAKAEAWTLEMIDRQP